MATVPAPRRQYLLAEALTFTIEAFERLPQLFRPENHITDLKKLLDAMHPTNISHLQWEARRYADILQGKQPEPPTRIV